MYVYDESYKLFCKDDFNDNEKTTDKKPDPIIYCYIPKIYKEDCYNAYNDIIENLKPKVRKIDIRSKKRITKKELEQKLLSNEKKFRNLYLINISLIIIIIGIIIGIKFKYH